MHKLTYSFLILAIVWLIAATVFLVQIIMKPKIGCIDLNTLVATQAQKISSLYPNGQLPPDQLQLLADNIKISVAVYAKENNLILLAKNAVWGGELIDHTQDLINTHFDGAF